MPENCIARIAVSAATYWTDRPYDYNVPSALAQTVKPGVRVIVPFSRGNRPCEGVVLSLIQESSFGQLKSISRVLDEEPILTESQIKLALWMRERCFCTVYDAVKAILPAGLWFDVSQKIHLQEGMDREQAYALAGKSKQQTQVLDILFSNGGSCDKSVILAAFGDADPNNALRELVKKSVIGNLSLEKRKVNDKMRDYLCLAVSSEEAAEKAQQDARKAPVRSALMQLLASVGRVSADEAKYFTGCNLTQINALKKAGLITIEQEEVYRHKVTYDGPLQPIPPLTEAQQAAYDGIMAMADGPVPGCGLLLGVTGSGKTTVYIHLIQEMLRRGKTAMLLVPEIALTPQMLRTFSSHFGETIAVLHSSLSIAERYDEWKRVKTGQAKVVIGTRSAVFAPLTDLGIIIMDEEQESTYKSENAPRYHAREIAKYLCAKSGASLLLGSATPCMETRYAAQQGRYHLFTLPGRFNESELPPAIVVDMKQELRKGNGGEISSFLRDELELNLENGEQSILFINRRGSSKLITCGECGYTYRCENCSANMTYHTANHKLMCHYCGAVRNVDDRCPECGGILKYTGAGTQKIQEELEALFPGVEVLRMDTDTVGASGSHEALLKRFREEKIPIMIGTQMVTKGLDFEQVTLVGVISADQSLYTGSFRSAERTFSLITQVVGRCGRGSKPGRAIIQTYSPENETIRQAASQDYDAFYASELTMRELGSYPPFTDMVELTVTGGTESTVHRCASYIRNDLLRTLQNVDSARVLGPAPYAVVRVNNRYRYRVTLLCHLTKNIRQILADILCHYNTDKAFKGVSVFADAYPTE